MSDPGLEKINAVKQRWDARWLAQPGVTGTDVGYRMSRGQPTDILAIRIYVASKSTAPPEIARLTEVEGVPVDVIERKFELQSPAAKSVRGATFPGKPSKP